MIESRAVKYQSVHSIARTLLCGLFLFTAASAQQPALTVQGDSSTYAPGAAVQLTVSLANSTNAAGSATNVSFALSAPGLTINAAGITTADVSKTSICYQQTPQTLTCVVLGIAAGTTPPVLNELPIPNGPLVSIPATIAPGTPPGPLTVMISQTDGSAPSTLPDGTTDSVDVPIAGQGITFTVLPSACDLNGDGKIDATDVNLAANAFARDQPGSIGWALTLVNVSRVLEAAITGVCKL